MWGSTFETCVDICDSKAKASAEDCDKTPNYKDNPDRRRQCKDWFSGNFKESCHKLCKERFNRK